MAKKKLPPALAAYNAARKAGKAAPSKRKAAPKRAARKKR